MKIPFVLMQLMPIPKWTQRIGNSQLSDYIKLNYHDEKKEK